MYKSGWGGGLLQFLIPADSEYAIGWLVHFGPEPIVFYSSLEWPQRYRELSEKVFLAPDTETLHIATREMIHYVSEEAMIIPIAALGSSFIAAPYVHTTRLQQHMMVWNTYNIWLDKH